jgi:hypothetical protein
MWAVLPCRLEQPQHLVGVVGGPRRRGLARLQQDLGERGQDPHVPAALGGDADADGDRLAAPVDRVREANERQRVRWTERLAARVPCGMATPSPT